MNNNMLMKVAVSSLLVGTMMTGCKGSGQDRPLTLSGKAVSAKAGTNAAKKAEKAFKKGKITDALAYSEQAVAADPRNADHRALLGRAYMANGRFVSAERTFQDVQELGVVDGRNVVSLALSQIGQGKIVRAKRVLRANRRLIPTSDYGLALALAGDTKDGVEILIGAIRSSSATAKTRQNLALAYALDGRWREAKVMAVQDMSPDLVDKRIMEWAKMTRPGAYQTRVATLLSVTPQADGGQPVQLALADTAPVVTASQDYKTEVSSFDSKKPLAAVGPAPKSGSKDVFAEAAEVNVQMAMSKSAPEKAPLIRASTQPVKTVPVPAAKAPKFVEEKTASSKPAPVKAVAVKPVKAAPAVVKPSTPTKALFRKASYVKPAAVPAARRGPSGTHVVQLGAFSSTANAKRAWGILSSKYKSLSGFNHGSSSVKSKGRTLYRLAATGFGNESAAKSMCDSIKASGGSCIVRPLKGGSPARMAQKKGRQIASR